MLKLIMGWKLIILYEGSTPNSDFEDSFIYLVPDAQTLLQNSTGETPPLPAQRPIFLYVGHITARKGIKPLIEACTILKKQGYTNYSTTVLCSRWAEAAELVVDGESGYIFDPYKPEELAEKMRHCLDRPELIKIMGDRAKELIGKTNYQTAADGFIEVINRVIN